jgi:hypothetical protein
MTRKDFDFIADMFNYIRENKLKTARDICVWRIIIKHFADSLPNKNPRFNKQRFFNACGDWLVDVNLHD